MTYTADQWAVATGLWEDRVPPKAVYLATGIAPSALYWKLPKRGAPRVPAKLLAQIKADWCSPMTITQMAAKYGLHKSRFGQLATQHGWPRDHKHPGRDPLAQIQHRAKAKTPQWKRCCGQRLPYEAPCPTCI